MTLPNERRRAAEEWAMATGYTATYDRSRLAEGHEAGQAVGEARVIAWLRSEDAAEMCNQGVDRGRFGILWKSPMYAADWLEAKLKEVGE